MADNLFTLDQVHAHGGGVLKVKDTFYWFGESYKRPLLGDFLSEGVNLYSSTDMATWHYVGLVFNGTQQMVDLPADMGSAPFRIERPKVLLSSLHAHTASHLALCTLHSDALPCQLPLPTVMRNTSALLQATVTFNHPLPRTSPLLRRPNFTPGLHAAAAGLTALTNDVQILYNEAYNNYVLLFHSDTPKFGYPSVGVAVAKEITGPYEWVRCFQPDGKASYDMGVFQEDDGTAFLVRSVENKYVGISQLSPDYTDTLGISSTAPQVRPPLL